MIAGVTWTKLIRLGYVYYSWQGGPTAPPDCQGNYSYGPDWNGPQLIRQVGRQLRIWQGSDQLLYDFDLQVGDTLPPSFVNYGSLITVIAVDSVLLGTEMRARYELGGGAQYLIEGVGTTNGLLAPMDWIDCVNYLDCFGFDGTVYYSDPDAPCDLYNGVMDKTHYIYPRITPNPGTDHFSLSLAPGPHTITLFDATGRPVHQQRTQDERATINTVHLPSGIYFVKVDDGLQPLRWVKE